MDEDEILRQCLEWNAKIEKQYKRTRPDKRYLEQKKEMDKFTEENSRLIPAPKHNVLSVCSETLHNQKESPIFFVRERQIFEKEDGLTWVYLGDLFDLSGDKVNYRTTTTYIPEKYLENLIV